ncbi:acetyltransferase, partial [Vibrio xuii]
IQLLEMLSLQAGDTGTGLDISMEKNKDGLNAALGAGAHVFYADHHKAGQIPESALLDAHIDLDANVCTALIIDRLLGGQYHLWAITAAYGDNLISRADELADKANLTSEQKAQLKELGTLINYNGYGAQLDDLHFSPATLFTELLAYDDPFAVIADQESPYHVLKRAYQEDMAQALSIKAKYQSPLLGVFELPDEPYSRRVSGVYGNLLANQSPD